MPDLHPDATKLSSFVASFVLTTAKDLAVRVAAARKLKLPADRPVLEVLIWMKFGGTPSILFGAGLIQILGAIRAEARAGDLAEVLFFLSGKQRTTLPISDQPVFTKFAYKTCF